MKATLVHRDGDRATVRLTPGRIARWFGAQTVDVELVYSDEVPVGWHAVGSRRPIDSLPYREELEHALDFVPVADPPIAVARDFVQLRRHR